MSSRPLPDHSSITSSPERPRLNVEGRSLPFNRNTTSPGTESVVPEPELQAILEQAMEGTGATGAAIALSTEGTVCCRASTGIPAPEVGTRLHAGISLTGLCLETGEVLLCNDTSTDVRIDPQLCKETGIRSVLVLPIKQNAKVVGVLLLLSINPNAFSQYDPTKISKLTDRVSPSSSGSTTISDRCLEQLPSNHSKAGRDCQELLTHADVFEEQNIRSPSTDLAGAPEWHGHYIESQSADQPVTMTSQDHRSKARWSTAGLATALALVICGYGYHLAHPKVGTNVAILPIPATNHKSAIPNHPHTLSEKDEKADGPLKSQSVLIATRQEVILAIQEPVQSTDVNRMLNQSGAGNSSAQYQTALRHANAEGGPQNYRNAMAGFAKAAANGDSSAQWKLGLGYLKGIGVPHDERKAGLWFKRAANGGDIRAQSALSDLYFSGRGVPIDYVRAYTWASIAAELRGKDNDRLRIIGSRMTAVQIEDAYRRISSWREQQTRQAARP